MLTKLLTPLLFLAAQFAVAWYGNMSAKLGDKGSFLGFNYDSAFIRSLVTQFEFLWYIVLLNLLFTYGFKIGFQSYDSFLILMFLWIASGPIAALLYNTFIIKESLNWVIAVGVTLIFIGAFLVAGNKEIMALFK